MRSSLIRYLCVLMLRLISDFQSFNTLPNITMYVIVRNRASGRGESSDGWNYAKRSPTEQELDAATSCPSAWGHTGLLVNA